MAPIFAARWLARIALGHGVHQLRRGRALGQVERQQVGHLRLGQVRQGVYHGDAVELAQALRHPGDGRDELDLVGEPPRQELQREGLLAHGLPEVQQQHQARRVLQVARRGGEDLEELFLWRPAIAGQQGRQERLGVGQQLGARGLPVLALRPGGVRGCEPGDDRVVAVGGVRQEAQVAELHEVAAGGLGIAAEAAQEVGLPAARLAADDERLAPLALDHSPEPCDRRLPADEGEPSQCLCSVNAVVT